LRADGAFWFFQMVFVATAASIVSGALAERLKLWPFLAFVAVLSAVIYPIVGSWTWGGGWLAAQGFYDFAGSTVVHSVGGWAALAGALLLGARRGRFDDSGRSTPLPSASAPQMAIGTLILWFGWFGFNGGSLLSFSSMDDAIAVAQILANTNLAAAGGVLAALAVSQFLRGRPDLALTLNGALAGLVAITAEPSAPTMLQAMLIGAGGALVMLAATWLLERFRIDDVVGAVPVHLAAGIFGTLVAGITSPDGSLGAQILGIASIGAFTFLASFCVWWVMKVMVGIRLHYTAEEKGSDISEMGARAYHLDLEQIDRPHPRGSWAAVESVVESA
jgi:Amt family ammonium transporter